MGGALALKYALDAIDDKTLKPPRRLVLITPMIGITRLARIAGFAALPAMLPAFAKAAWLSVTPEFSPFKYNSFPVNGGAAVSTSRRRLAGANCAICPRGEARSATANPHLSVHCGLYGQHK